MSDVYRYDLSLPTNAKNFGMRLSENGCWVEHESYAALEAERDQLRARVEELEVENLALQNVLSSQQRAPSLEKLVADLRRTELEALRASIVALAEGLDGVNESWAEYIVGELRQLGEGNGRD